MNNEQENKEILKAAIAILNYLRDHKHAKDNIEGIAQWWVGEKKSVVESALILLLDYEVIEEKEGYYYLSLNWQKNNNTDKFDRLVKQLKN